jgi:quercetin dioxygenase-like cupin family protein
MDSFRLIVAAAVMFAASCSVSAPETVAPSRETGSQTVLRTPLEAAGGFEVIVQDSYFAANATLPRHYHPGEEHTYIIEGEITLIEDGKEDRLMHAGETFTVGAGKIHAAKTGAVAARAITVRVHPVGSPERTIID